MAKNFYFKYLNNEVFSLLILFDKASQNLSRRPLLLSAANTQTDYIFELTNSLYELKITGVNEVQSLLRVLSGRLQDPKHVYFDELFELSYKLMAKCSTSLAEAPPNLIATWANIYAIDNHAITSRADKSGIIISVNDNFSKVSGYQPHELIGEDHAILNSGHHAKGFFKEMWQQIFSGRTWNGTVCNKNKQGGFYWVESSISPVFNNAGEILYFVSIRTDITEVKKLEEEASKAESRLRLSQQFANIGTWEWHIEHGDLWWSDRIAPMFGGERTEMSTSYENFINAVHEDDRFMLQSAVQACIEDGQEYDIEHRVVWPNGEVRWLHERGDVLRSANGDPVSMLGAVQDITQKKHFERIMVRQQRLLDILHETTLTYLTTQDFARFCEDMLDNLLQVSGAELAMVGEVEHDEKGHSLLKNRFIKDVGWDDERRRHYQKQLNAGQLKHLQVLFDHTLDNQELLIVNDPFSYPKYHPSPESGVCVENYIGIPVFMGTDLCGMFSLVNRSDGFDYDLYELLSPFIATFGVMIFSKRLQEQEEVRVRELNTARLRAEDANRSKSAFLSSMSHELRTPLNAIIGFGQLLSMSELTEAQAEQVQDVLQSSQHLLTLINDVLDLARIDAGQLMLEIKPVDIDRVVNEALQMVQHLAEHHQVEIRLSEALGEKKGMADFTRLKQVMINFLTNAIKYNRPGGQVYIDIEEGAETGKYRLLVEDSGIGIPESVQSKIFEPFNRLGHEARSIEGTGIGLTISKMLAEAMNGDIGFRSVEGKGSVFWISLPSETSTKASIEMPRKEVPEFQIPEVHNDGQSAQPGAVESPKTKKVLYIEDNVANMKLMSEIVKKVPSIELFISVSAEEGIDKVKALAPDLILVDINLPGMSGQEALPVLRQTLSENGLSAEIVAISANAMPQEVDDGIRSGFDGYLTKPVSVVEVVNLLKQIERKS